MQAGPLLAPGAWSWWTQPRAVEHAGKLYIGSTSPLGAIVVDAVDGSTVTRTTLNTFAPDDHHNPAIIIRAGKEPLAFYSRHNDDSLLRWRKGTTAIESGFVFAAEQTRAFTGTVTYAVAHDRGGDLIDVWARDGSTNWSVTQSTDWGATFGVPIRVFSADSQVYMASRLVGTTLRCALQIHPNTSAFDPTVAYAEIDMTTGSISKSDGTVLGNLDGTNLPLHTSDLEQVATPAGALRGWLFDVGAEANPQIVWASFDPDDVVNTGMYHLTTRSGVSTWTTADVVATGDAFMAEDDDYPGSGHLAADGTLYLSREEDGVWYIERRDGSTTVLMATRDRLLVRPFPLVGGTTYECAFMAMSSYTDFEHFSGRIKVV